MQHSVDSTVLMGTKTISVWWKFSKERLQAQNVQFFLAFQSDLHNLNHIKKRGNLDFYCLYQANITSELCVFFKSSPWKGFCLILLNTKSFFAESIHFQWFTALCSSELAVVFLSKAFKAVVHEECFPLLYKFVHQHPGSDSLFFLTPPDRAPRGCVLLTWRVSYCPGAPPPVSVQTFLEDLRCLHVSVSPFSSWTIGVQVERKPILWELHTHIPSVRSNQLKDIS